MRIGIVGTNFVSDMFMEAASFVKEIEVSAVISRQRAHANAFAAKYQIPHVFDTLAQMLDAGCIDAVYLAVPNSLHDEQTIFCLQHHMPVMTEKPFAATAAQAREMIACAQANDTYLHDGIVPLYTDTFAALKQALPRVGRLRRAVISMSKYSSRYDAYLAGKNPTTFRRELCNGSWMDLGIYCIADAVGLFGRPRAITARSVLLDTGVDALGSAILSYDGFDAVLLHSKVNDTRVVSEIEGESGLIQFEPASRPQHITLTARKASQSEVIGEPCENEWSCQLRDFVANVTAGRKESARVPHALTMDMMEVLEECRRQSGVVFPADEENR